MCRCKPCFRCEQITSIGVRALRFDVRPATSVPIQSFKLFHIVDSGSPGPKELLTTLATWLVSAASTCKALRRESLRCLSRLAAVSGSLAIALDLVSALITPTPTSMDAPEPALDTTASLSAADIMFFSNGYRGLSVAPDATLAPALLAFLAEAAGAAVLGTPARGSLEAPLCIEISRSMFTTSLRIIEVCISEAAAEGPNAAAADSIVSNMLRLLEHNLRYLQLSCVDPSLIHLTGGNDDPVDALAHILMTFVLGRAPGVSSNISEAASQLMLAQLKLFMRIAPAATATGVIDLYRIHTSTPLPAGSNRVRLVEECLKLLASDVASGGQGAEILKVPDTSSSASDYCDSSVRASTRKILETLFSVPAGTGMCGFSHVTICVVPV